MTEQWQELKETIIELRDNDGAGTQQEICKFLVNYMDVLEKQMSEPKLIQEKQAESEKYQKAFDDGYDNGYAQARFDYEQEPKWIPVRERLPERAYGCLVTVEIDNVLTGECVPTILNYLVGYDGETWNNSDGIPIPYEVIAWMLPKPYKAESEG